MHAQQRLHCSRPMARRGKEGSFDGGKDNDCKYFGLGATANLHCVIVSRALARDGVGSGGSRDIGRKYLAVSKIANQDARYQHTVPNNGLGLASLRFCRRWRVVSSSCESAPWRQMRRRDGWRRRRYVGARQMLSCLIEVEAREQRVLSSLILRHKGSRRASVANPCKLRGVTQGVAGQLPRLLDASILRQIRPAMVLPAGGRGIVECAGPSMRCRYRTVQVAVRTRPTGPGTGRAGSDDDGQWRCRLGRDTEGADDEEGKSVRSGGASREN